MSWAGIAANQGVSLNNLQNAVDTSVFTLKNTIPAGTKQITKTEAAYYVNINTGYAPYAAKTSNQLVVKSNLIAATPLPYSYTVYYNNIDEFDRYAGFSTSSAACAASTNYIVVYSNSSSITAGTEFSISPYGDDPPGQIFVSYDNSSGNIYFKIGSNYVTFQNYDGTYYGYIIESVGSCAPTATEYRAYGYDEDLRSNACIANNLTGSPQTVYAGTSNPYAVTQFYNNPELTNPWTNLPGNGYAVSFSTAADTLTRYAGYGTTGGAINSVIAC